MFPSRFTKLWRSRAESCRAKAEYATPRRGARERRQVSAKSQMEAIGPCTQQHPIDRTSERTSWRRWSALVMVLLIAAPVIARETDRIAEIRYGSTGTRGGRHAESSVPEQQQCGKHTYCCVNYWRKRHAILEFDLSRIPNVGVRQATLTLHVVTAPSASVTYGAYPYLIFGRRTPRLGKRAWPQPAWTTAGGDAAATATGTAKSTPAARPPRSR